MKNNSIETTLAEIEKVSGLRLITCDNFKGICYHNKRPYFNIMLTTMASESSEYNKLLDLIKYGFISHVEPNGYKRLAIFF